MRYNLRSSKKRKAESVQNNNKEAIVARQCPVKQAIVKQDAKQQQFLDDKLSLWQQGMGKLNERTKIVFKEHVNSDEDALFASMEYNRQRDMITSLYNPGIGNALSTGNDDCNQLGIAVSADADKACVYAPKLVNALANNIVHVAAGGLHSLALTKSGVAFSWGVNDDNALGRGEIEENELHLVEPITQGFSPEDLNPIVAIGAGDSHSLFLSIGGSVYQCGMYKDDAGSKFCIGENPQGSNMYPTKVAFPKHVRAIAAGESFSAAISSDGDLYTWGMGHHGQLARSSTMDAPRKPSGDATAPTIFELGKFWIGEEYWTGKFETNEEGEQILDKSGNPVKIMDYRYFLDIIKKKFLTPAPVCWADRFPKRIVLNVACGQLHMVVVARDDKYDTSVYSAGHNGFGQLGHGDKYERHELTVINALERKLINKVAAGTSHSLALTMSGTGVFGWGRSDHGELGHCSSPGDCELSPTQIAFPTEMTNNRIVDIEAGYSVSMAITDTNEVYTWGFGESGATGHKGDADILRPGKLNVLERPSGEDSQCRVLEAACGGQHSLMVVQRHEDTKDDGRKPAGKKKKKYFVKKGGDRKPAAKTDAVMTDA